MKVEFKYYNGYVNKFETLTPLIHPKIELEQWNKTILEGYDNCFEKDGIYMVIVPGCVFRFDSKKDAALFISKTPFIRVSKEGPPIYFELIDKKELQVILEQDEIEKIGVDSEEGVNIYRFKDGRILSADIYNRSAELYTSESDYKAISGTFRS